jgi:hypothetical protein
MIVDFPGCEGLNIGLVILVCYVHRVGYNLQAGIVLQVRIVSQFEFDPQTDFVPHGYISLQEESGNQE